MDGSNQQYMHGAPEKNRLQNIAPGTEPARPTMNDQVDSLHKALALIEGEIDQLGSDLNPLLVPLQDDPQIGEDQGIVKDTEIQSEMAARVAGATRSARDLRRRIYDIRRSLDL